jgi:hypothetical protein
VSTIGSRSVRRDTHHLTQLGVSLAATASAPATSAKTARVALAGVIATTPPDKCLRSESANGGEWLEHEEQPTQGRHQE